MDLDPDTQALLDGRPLATPPGVLLDRLVARRRHLDDSDANGAPSLDMTDVFGGVTVGWLSKVFAMDPTTVKQKLADCPVLHRRKAGYVYDLKQAAQYLVRPVFDIDKYMRNMKASEMPSHLQATFWDAALKRQKWEENARHLWRDEDVIEVLSSVFKTLKTSTQLWADNLDMLVGINEQQRNILAGAIDSLQKEMYQRLIVLAKNRKTTSSLDEKTEIEGHELL